MRVRPPGSRERGLPGEVRGLCCEAGISRGCGQRVAQVDGGCAISGGAGGLVLLDQGQNSDWGHIQGQAVA